MGETTLQLEYSEMVPGLFNIPSLVNVYKDEKNELWEFLYSKKGTEKAKSGVDAIVYLLNKPVIYKVAGRVKAKSEDLLVLETEDDEYTFKYMTQKELDATENFRKTKGLVGMAENVQKMVDEMRKSRMLQEKNPITY